MSTWTASAPGKIILCGEHAAVYGQPAIALPVFDVRATATAHSGVLNTGIIIESPSLQQTIRTAEDPDHPLSRLCMLVQQELATTNKDLRIIVESNIPVAGGMGSGAAVSAAVARVLAQASGTQLATEILSKIVFEIEKIYHGSPSGIDNTVICHELPIFFQRGQPPEILRIGNPFQLIVADSGVGTPTHLAVEAVKTLYGSDPAAIGEVLASIGNVVRLARTELTEGEPIRLGELLNQNHALLQKLGVSTTQLDSIAEAARRAGAWGAKLSGAGMGGNVIAISTPEKIDSISEMMLEAGAVRIMVSTAE
jgi:mevalonate kinase